jgi:hypothetical protein
MILQKSTIYRCDVCGKQSTWNDSWCTHVFPFDIRGDMTFHICSEYCDRQLLNMTKVQKKKIYLNNQRDGGN